ncbi:uncharacterized protein LOC132204638 [Neocloeon triangulifer]|uniref:uncharacterized protein LOC132204638 n=1 Tax=Neocloeon triangulifer TaxID=2078957 RepID=UPI00286F2F62|nr:uncharacterized protein LOC132204638 [Neocloeon triangulifer]
MARVLLIIAAIAVVGAAGANTKDNTAIEVLKHVYHECVQYGSLSCVKPKLLAFISTAVKHDQIPVTKDMAIVRRDGAPTPSDTFLQAEMEQLPLNNEERRESLRVMALDRIDDFIATHDLKIRVPKEIVGLASYVPKSLIDIPAEVTVPLSNGPVAQQRGFVKKVVIPFLLGLKFKATALMPLALALIALKTWKALTLGLLSMVLSAAMVVFKFTKPKVVNYEVYHYPQPHLSYEHHPVPETHGWGRELPYQGWTQECLIVACLAFGALAVPIHEEPRALEDEDFLSGLQKYVKESEVDVTVPEGMSVLSGTQFSFSPRNIDQDELTLTVKLPASAEAKSLGEARKGKLKKIIIPILVFVLLKAMTLVPLAIGVLGLKAWNALQLSFFSFVISVALAVFQLCKKIAADASQSQAHYATYDAYNAHYARGFASGVVAAADEAQDIAYNAHKQE